MTCTGPCNQGRDKCPTPQVCETPEPLHQIIAQRVSIGFMTVVATISLFWLLFGS